MKALILAAGLGTRLLPYSQHTPKPLFTLNQRPVLDLIVGQLFTAGCRAVIVNTHHHHEQIENFITARKYPMPVYCRHEPQILGTGGAIRNIADFWSNGPLLVINADIVTDINVRQIYQFHVAHTDPVTMAMHDYPQFNGVSVNASDYVVDFDPTHSLDQGCRYLAFTGIHVIHRRVLDFLPPTGPAHIVNAYTRMLQAGERIKAYVVHGHRWRDIGTPESYQAAIFEHMGPAAFERAFGAPCQGNIQKTELKGDGSDRRWSRLKAGRESLIMVDHGIRPDAQNRQEVDAFIDIGTHLLAQGVAVPEIFLYDRFSGVVFLQDLGDLHLQEAVLKLHQEKRKPLYRQVIDQWLHMAVEGAKNFDTHWTYQTARYDRELILDRECRYFIEAFVNGYLGRSLSYADWVEEFQALADLAIRYGVMGFIHRDLQSRNIMIHDDRIYFIDFQGGRLGPIQYDLAALLIDPYVALSPELQAELCHDAMESLYRLIQIDRDFFMQGYEYCALTRNLQMLGAFGFLSRVKGKDYFETFIPCAVKTLRRNLIAHRSTLPKLNALVEEIQGDMQG